jgi:hypothetical protein
VPRGQGRTAERRCSKQSRHPHIEVTVIVNNDVFAAPKPERPVKPPRERKPRKRPPEKNLARKAHRLITDFGGAEYNALLKSLPCAVCGVTGFSVAAHLTARGAGGKAEDQVPLCRTRFDIASGAMTEGCHEKYDDRQKAVRAFEERLRWLAKGLWWAWQAIT